MIDQRESAVVATDILTEATLVPWLQRLVRHPSQQTDLHEQDPEIGRFIRECAAPLLESLGADLRYDAMGNLIAEAGPADTGRSLLLVTYAMTHPAASMKDPFEATLIETAKGKAVRGRGVAEQKTALTAAIGAFGHALSQGGLKGRLALTLTTAGETGRHDAVRSVMEELGYDPQFAVICIGTDRRVAIGNKGRIDFDVIVGGKASHSSTPWNGINALSGARRVLEQLESFDLGVPDHPDFGPATLTPTALKTLPNATHTVPEAARITFDRRLLPGEHSEDAFQAITSRITLGEPWTVGFERGPVMFPNAISREGVLYAKLRDAYGAAGLGEPEAFYCNFALDAGYFCDKGIEAVMAGPGEVDQFHSTEENVLVSDLVGMAKVYYGLIEACLHDHD